jgi:hypothetical protein
MLRALGGEIHHLSVERLDVGLLAGTAAPDDIAPKA